MYPHQWFAVHSKALPNESRHFWWLNALQHGVRPTQNSNWWAMPTS